MMAFPNNYCRDFNKEIKLNQKIHSFRLPLSPRGQAVMGVVYFSIPCILGYGIMEWTNKISSEKRAVRRQELRAPSDATIAQNVALQQLLDTHRK